MANQRDTISMDASDVKRFVRQLKTHNAKAYPFATRATINKLAGQHQTEARRLLSRRMELRTPFVRSQIQVERTRTLRVSRQVALMGATNRARLLERFEFGAVKRARGSFVPIPTKIASGEGLGLGTRRRRINKAGKLSNIRILKSQTARRGRTAARRNWLTVQEAKTKGRKFVYIEGHGATPQGIYKLAGGKRNPKLRLVYLMSRRVVPIPRIPWINPSALRVRERTGAIYLKEIKRQLQRAGLHNLRLRASG